MGKFKDLTGQTFGKLTVIKRVEDQKAGRPTWLCQCECGNLTTVSSTRLKVMWLSQTPALPLPD